MGDQRGGATSSHGGVRKAFLCSPAQPQAWEGSSEEWRFFSSLIGGDRHPVVSKSTHHTWAMVTMSRVEHRGGLVGFGTPP